MKYLCFLIFAFGVEAFEFHESMARSESDPTTPVSLASVRDSKTDLPKCVGTFVTTNILVTTGKCVECLDKCNYVVQISENGAMKPVKYNVKSVKIHEDYETDPLNNNIGLIFLSDTFPDSVVVDLADFKIDPISLPIYSYIRKQSKQFLEPEKVTVMTRSKCTFDLHEYISQSQICTTSKMNYNFVEQDQGSPLMYSYSGKSHLLGMYSPLNPEYEQKGKIGVYRLIYQHISWINKHAKNLVSSPICI